MPRWISLTVTAVATLALLAAGGFVLARWNEWDAAVGVLAPTLKYSLYAIAGCCGYAGLVGVYHTFLSITGLDEARGRGHERHRASASAGDDGES